MRIPSLAVTIGLGRAALGAAAYASPELLARPPGNMAGITATPDTIYMTRLFGARDLTVGVLTVLPPTRRGALAIGTVFDVLDVGSGLQAEKDGMPAGRSRLVTGAAGAFAAAGVLALIMAGGTKQRRQ